MAMRQESVRLSLIDNFTPGMAKATAATALFKQSLDNLDGTSVRTSAAVDEIGDAAQRTDAKLRKSGADIDRFSGRVRLLVDAALAVGPALAPIGAVGVAGVAGLASQLGFAAVGAGSLIVAAQGVGDALGAINDASLAPTVENIEKARTAMEGLSPSAREFVNAFQDFRPVLTDIRDSAAQGWFPGLTASLDELARVGPRVADIFLLIGDAGGRLAAEGAEALNTRRWKEFFSFVETEAPAALEDLGRTVGNFTLGLGQMWEAFSPVNNDFSDWLLQASRDFVRWSDDLANNTSFQDFIDYIRETGPMVADAFGSMGSAVLELTRAFAPLGGPVLNVVANLADLLATIAASPIGTPLAALVTALSAFRLSSSAVVGIGRMADNFMAIGGAASGATGSIAGMAKQVGILGAAMLALDSGMDVFGYISRGMGDLNDAADADNVTQMLDALADTNLGKYAQDLGVDMQRLATDIVRFGGEGEYTQQVLEQLGGATDGLGGKVNALSDFLSPLVGDTEQARGALSDLQAVLYREDNPTFLDNVKQGLADIPKVKDNGLKEMFNDIVGGADQAADAATRLSTALASLSGWLDKREALRGYDDSLRDLSKSLRNGFTRADAENLDAVGRSIVQVATSIKSNKVRGDFLEGARESLRSLAQDAGPKAQAEIKALLRQMDDLGGKKVDPKIDINDKPAKQKLNSTERLLRELTGKKATPKVDADNKQATGKINATRGDLSRLDKQTANPRVTADTGSAVSQINAVRTALNSIPRSITTVVNTVRNVIGNPFGPPSAEGNFFPAVAYANGGMDRANAHQPELYRGGITRMWGEPETKGEAYIPLANDYRRPRAKSILEMTAAEFNGQVTWNAEGSLNTYARTRGTLSSQPYPLDGIAQFDRSLEIASRTMGAFEDRMRDSVKGEKDRNKKRLEMLTEQRDATRDMVKSLKDSAKSLGDSVSDMLRRDIWETPERREFNWSDESQAAIAQMSGEDQAKYAAERYRIEQLMNPMSSPEDQIRQTIRDANERLRLTRQLEEMGLRGPGLNELLTAPTDQLRAYANDPASARQFARLFNQQEKVLSKLSGAVGDAAYGKQIALQTKELRDMGRDIRDLKQEIAKQGKDGPERTGRAAGDAAGKAIRGEVVAGAKGRARR